MITVMGLLHHVGGSGLFDMLARGFVMSVGWMVARWIGLPWALAGVAVIGLWYVLRRRRAARTQSNIHNSV